MNVVYNMDCLKAMKEMPDNAFDLAVVDPPYGNALTNEDSGKISTDKNSLMISRGGGTESRNTTSARHHTFGARKRYSTYQNRRNMGGEVRKKIIAWDVAPGEEYFKELFRVSRNQIIWGGNYFSLPPTRCFLIWRKTNVPEKFSMAMAEYAWTSFNKNAKVFEKSAVGQPDRFHPTQKPVELYKWIYGMYAKQGDKILDTHLGSGSSRIAAYEMGFDFVGYEIDSEYYKLQEERFYKHTAQTELFHA